MVEKDYQVFEFEAHIPVRLRVVVHAPGTEGGNRNKACAAAIAFIEGDADVADDVRYQMDNNDLGGWEVVLEERVGDAEAYDGGGYVIDLEGNEL